eukprot:135957_1
MLISFSISLSFPFIFHREFMSLFDWEYVAFIDLYASFRPFHSVANAASSSVPSSDFIHNNILHAFVYYCFIIHTQSIDIHTIHSIHSSWLLFIYIAILQSK